MNLPDASFDLRNGMVGNREKFVGMFELAEDGVINGDGTFVYQHRLWKVSNGVSGEQYDVYSEQRPE